MRSTEPERLDHHFRPQHLNVLHGTAPLDFVGQLERMDKALEWLSVRGVRVADGPRQYATGANARVGELLDDSARRAVAEFYREDFARFGYSRDWLVLNPVGPSSLGGGSVGSLRAALS